jgi:hypothetical protein
MKSAISKSAFVSPLAVAILLCAISDVFAQSRGSIQLNQGAFAFAAQLINDGHIIVDRKGAWSGDRPPADQENEFIRVHGFSEYAKWHLGIDTRFAENTKRRYKFPYGDFKNVHRCGLLAARSRARQYKYSDIDDVAARLIELIQQRK